VSTSPDFLSTPLQFLKGVGPRRAADLARVGLTTVEHLLYRFPRRYEDRAHLLPIARARVGGTVSLCGTIRSSGLRATRRPGFKIFEALVTDDSGSIRAAWLNQPFLRDVLTEGLRVVLYGTVEVRGPGGPQLTNPQYEILEEEEAETIHTGRIVPIYERAGSLTPRMQRRLVHDVLGQLADSEVPDEIPDAVRARLGLPSRRAALLASHFPPADAPIDQLDRFETPAQRCLIFEEAFLFQRGVLARKRAAAAVRKPHSMTVDARVRAAALAVLPFRLTAGQKDALRDIVADLQRPEPMNRLLQGDVGAGKTIVALLAALVALENGLQVAFMAPTEILAEQHFATMVRLLSASRFKVALLTGSAGAAERHRQRAEIASGATHLIVGTHALVQGDIAFARLGFVVIDEQHRFGVLQRATLRQKGLQPDVLVMTATPIPRTLALTLYGDLDISVVRDLPPGRLPVKTIVKPEGRRDAIHEFVREQLAAGRQAYVVYPLVDESEKVDLKAATQMADHLAGEVFQGFRVGLLHGKLPAEGKDRVMKAFAAGEIDILVATTVVEVGLDVPNATIMVVEHAERFGLSQIHQLRGRVGRSSHQSYCCLIYQSPLSEEARERLTALAETTDGFEIAERDLALRGPGDFFGTRQAGLPTFRTIDLRRDRALLDLAHTEARAWIDATRPDDVLSLLEGWKTRFGLIDVG
jgi:ATP-dependent DNA helicase RecG